VKKKRLCIGIAKFYVKVAHVFASIIMTINPIYEYTGSDGKTVQKKIFEKDQIPKDVERKIKKMGICNTRIRALAKGNADNKEGTANYNPDVDYIHPTLCTGTSSKTNLAEEPGIPELVHLYYDKYDFSTGEFTGMTPNTEKQFKADLLRFYQVFTGNETMPADIKGFSQIPLRDYNKVQGCVNNGNNYNNNNVPPLKSNISLNKKGRESARKVQLFAQYASHLRDMISSTHKKQNELLEIINEIFTYVNDEQTSGKKRILIHPKLTDDLL
jgi:hypothetical protein